MKFLNYGKISLKIIFSYGHKSKLGVRQWLLKGTSGFEARPLPSYSAQLFSQFSNVNVPYEEGNMLSQADVAKRIKAIEMDMMNNGIQHNHLSMKNLVCHYFVFLIYFYFLFL